MEGKMQWSGPDPEDGWEQDVWLMARRLALMYYHFAQVIMERLGEEEGRRLIKEAVWRYGNACGKAVREGVERMGLEPTAENFRLIPDLPSRGWRRQTVKLPDGRRQVQTILCPFAVVWKELGAEDLGRIYCFVDQAKVEGYNPELECIHAHNVLDGDPFCEIVIRPKG